ncbi:FKBP-type peptidyl-prolyl cis-trans isomerase N-terminal domain-containing protein [Cellvibrio sp.]|uniref:FKBP-type peptidyl-prolyl cis-trans isomerase N-terminal domain-containing protein n=1 Tax=Cellvibrio sp. TaxID=1965322 RepID=UPI0039648902
MIFALLLSSCLVGCSQKDKAQQKPLVVQTLEQKAQYAIARGLALNLQKDGASLDAEVLAAAFKDVLLGQPSRLTEQEMNQAMAELQTKLEKKIRRAKKFQQQKPII